MKMGSCWGWTEEQDLYLWLNGDFDFACNAIFLLKKKDKQI